MLGRGIIPEVERTEINSEDALKEFIFLGLRKTDGVLITDAKQRGLDLLAASIALIREGYLSHHGGHIHLSRKGLPLANMVIVELLRNLGL